MRRSRHPSRSMSARACSCENPLTTFTNEQAIYLVVGGTVVAGILGYLLFKTGASSQQIADLQAYNAGTFGSGSATSGT